MAMRALRELPGGAALGLALAMVAVGTAHAGGTIGWATAVQQFETEGISVGGLAVVLSIMALGIVVGFGMHSFLPVVVAACLGGALMANAQQVASIFGGGAGGGSIHAVQWAAALSHVLPLA